MSKKLKNGGFTLVEALVAITILTVSIVGPITIASKGMAASVFARDQITAFYLAQEAVEYIRNKRDENNIQGNNWLFGLSECIGGNVCMIDIQNNNIELCQGGACPVLKYNDTTGFYNYETGNNSNFIREIKIDTVDDKEVSITTTLSWKTGVISKTFTVKEHILDW
ncbi:MAG: prepilin-type N-terminal cleavage/methylation domain-containing protein [Candidatus Pacebacteria bacterium]|jgi:type II secretory pathway pseudopilin PulG|nr:prepilin-type N-terminal cleavage/methylation domain-containing protein [Candidatus Paceibacterota bacterium]|tara:strand:+ start:38534 stop:39034 length:501 start_codon:yes stop_codon:yes gene_type:complete